MGDDYFSDWLISDWLNGIWGGLVYPLAFFISLGLVMVLYTRCKDCGGEISFRSRSKDRFVLARKKGEEVELDCPKCFKRNKYHVDEIKATEDRMLKFSVLLILLTGTIFLVALVWDYLFRLSNLYAVGGLVGMIIISSVLFKTLILSHENDVRYYNRKPYKRISYSVKSKDKETPRARTEKRFEEQRSTNHPPFSI